MKKIVLSALAALTMTTAINAETTAEVSNIEKTF